MTKQLQCSNYSELVESLKEILLEDRNSISNQLVLATKYLRISKLIEWCSKQEKSCFHNPDLKIFSESGIVSTHSIYVRGLAYGSQSNEISLKRVHLLLKTNSHLINRKNYVCFEGIPYDYEAQLNAERKELLQKLGPFECATRNESSAEKSKKRHVKFDALSNKHIIAVRKETDSICEVFLNEIDSELKKCENTKKFANICIVHRQLEKIRKGQESQNDTIIQFKIEKIEQNYISLWKVFNTFIHYFFDTDYYPILSMTHQFSLIDKPMIESDKITEYKSLMNKLEEEDNSKYSKLLKFK